MQEASRHVASALNSLHRQRLAQAWCKYCLSLDVFCKVLRLCLSVVGLGRPLLVRNQKAWGVGRAVRVCVKGMWTGPGMGGSESQRQTTSSVKQGCPQERIFFCSGQPLRTAVGDHQRPTANRGQPPTVTNRQPLTITDHRLPTINRQLPTAQRHQPPVANQHQPPTAANRQRLFKNASVVSCLTMKQRASP